MNWETDSKFDDPEMEPYSSFQSNKSWKLFDRMELPIILIGAGLLAIVILFVMFIPKKNEVTMDDYKHLAIRLDKLEHRINQLSGQGIDVREFDPNNNPVQYQQVINWIKSNAEVISETIKKVDNIEQALKNGEKPRSIASAKSKPGKPGLKKERTAPAVKPQAAHKTPIEKKVVEKSIPIKIKPRQKPAAEATAEKKETIKPVIASPEKKNPAKPVAAPETVKPETVKPEPVKTEPVKTEPGTVKLIFHRVEKGETLYHISRIYGLTVEELQKLNDMKKDDLIIHVGQELIVKKEKQ